MISALARGDYDDFVEKGLKPTLDDFDRLNSLALRMTDGAETTAANFPRVGWAGDVPFYEPTAQALIWYLSTVRHIKSIHSQNIAWFYALAHARIRGAFDEMGDISEIVEVTDEWFGKLPLTYAEVSRACYYAAHGFDDAIAGMTDAEFARTLDEVLDGKLDAIHKTIIENVAATGLSIEDLRRETPRTLLALKLEAKKKTGERLGLDKTAMQKDYDLARREIHKRLVAEKEDLEKREAENG